MELSSFTKYDLWMKNWNLSKLWRLTANNSLTTSQTKARRSMHLLLFIFLLLCLIMPQVPAIIKHLNQLGSKFDILLSYWPMNYQSIDGTHTLLQLSVDYCADVTVTYLHSNIHTVISVNKKHINNSNIQVPSLLTAGTVLRECS